MCRIELFAWATVHGIHLRRTVVRTVHRRNALCAMFCPMQLHISRINKNLLKKPIDQNHSNCCLKCAAYIQNSSIAVCTSWAEQIMIIWFTIWMSVAFKEAACAELLGAVTASEVLRMPSAS